MHLTVHERVLSTYHCRRSSFHSCIRKSSATAKMWKTNVHYIRSMMGLRCHAEERSLARHGYHTRHPFLLDQLTRDLQKCHVVVTVMDRYQHFSMFCTKLTPVLLHLSQHLAQYRRAHGIAHVDIQVRGQIISSIVGDNLY